MAASPSALNSASYEVETNFGETTTTAATLRLPLCAPIDTSGLKHGLIDANLIKQNGMDGVAWIPGIMEGSFKTKMWLFGHGSATTGATSIGLVEALIGNLVLGSGSGAAVSAASGTTATGGTAAAWTTTASGTIAQGAIISGGTLNDGKLGGQCYVGTHATTTYTPLNQPAGAPTTGNLICSGVTGYTQSTTSTQKSARFLLQNKGYQYLCHGCYPTAVTWAGLNDGEVPSIEITWAVAWWEYSTATFPSTVTTETFTPAVTAAGSYWINSVGTATYQVRSTIRSFSLEHKLNTIPLMGSGGNSPYQKVQGVIRGLGSETVKVSFVDDSESTTGTPYWQGLQKAGTAQHLMRTLNSVNGKQMAFYFPNLNFCDDISSQFNDGGINRVKVVLEANTGPDSTSELTKSAMRVGWL